MNQNVKILLVALVIFFLSMSFWILLLDGNPGENNLNLVETSQHYQSNIYVVPTPE